VSETTGRSGLPRASREARAALTGIGVAVLLMAAVAIRFTPGGTVGTNLARATTSTHASPTFWVIHAGQTIGLVSAVTGLSVAVIEQLNPHADPGELVPGQRIRLKATPPKPLPKS
jgi:hypothetical protein